MKYLPILILIASVVSCNAQEDRVPYELQPDGLKKKIEAELIANSKEEIKASMHALHDLWSDGPPLYCGGWQHLCTNRNKANQIKVRGDIIDSISQIQAEVFLYYTANAHLSSSEVSVKIQDPNYQYYGYPFHSRISAEAIETRVREHQELLKMAQEENDPNLIRFYSFALKDWRMKQEVISTIGATELTEIQYSAIVEIWDETNKKGFSPLTDEAIKAILNVRNDASEKYFNTSYYELYFNATRYNDLEAQQKVRAIDYLYKMKITDESYARINNLTTVANPYRWPEEIFEIPPPEPIGH